MKKFFIVSILFTFGCSSSAFNTAKSGSERKDSGVEDTDPAILTPDSNGLGKDVLDKADINYAPEDSGSLKDTAVPCTPLSKAEACLSRECGEVTDGCGGKYVCGMCPVPQTCGGGIEAWKCGCTPYSKSTACVNIECGIVPDGCGRTIACDDTCVRPKTCGGAGEPNKCGCTPKTPAEVCGTFECGKVSDGCGGLVACGTCQNGEACGMKQQNMCDPCDALPGLSCPGTRPYGRTCPPDYRNPDCAQLYTNGTSFCCSIPA